jgi:biopolymer transport protein ExbB/TolQ
MSSSLKNSPPAHKRPNWAATILASPLLWGGALTVGFYSLLPYFPVQKELTHRYFCGHPVEYSTTALFFIATCMLGGKALRLTKECAILADDRFLSALEAEASSSPTKTADALYERINSFPASLQTVKLVGRLRDACSHVKAQQSADRLEDHLKYLAELASERLHASFALIRTIIWAIPILGFLGTVLGITIAIANVTPDQLESSLDSVTGGLAVAFDTTALALALSLALVFCSFVVERSEQRLLADVEEFGIRRIGTLFPPTGVAANPLAKAEAEAARTLLSKTESLITWQTELWQDGLEALRKRWAETLEAQKSDLDGALRKGMSATLADHAQHLGQIRSELVQTFEAAARALADVVSDQQREQRAHLERFADRLHDLWARVHDETSSRQSEGLIRVERACESVAETARNWQAGLEQAAQAAADQLEELRGQREVLSQIVAESTQLSDLQGRLCDNLDAIRATETFEQTLHTLNAAVNLLAARTHLRAA